MSVTTFIDTDTHVTEPADLWTSRLPKKWGDQVMHVRWSGEHDSEVWCIGDRVVTKAWSGCSYGFGTFPHVPRRLDEAHPATYDVAARVALMDEYGARAQVLYPNIAGLCFDPFVDFPDPKISVAHAAAYNDFQLELAASAPGRFVPMLVAPYWDVPAAVAEIQRMTGKGFGGIVMTGVPQIHDQPYLGDHHWDPMWQACSDSNFAVAFHVANGDLSDQFAPARVALDGHAATMTRTTAAASLDNAKQITDLLTSGVLARYPNLNFISVESGLGWVPYVLESCDYHFKLTRMDKERPEYNDLLPSDLFRRQVYVNYWFEQLQPWHIDAIGIDHILFETDFPHGTCLHPDGARRAIDIGLADLAPADLEKILWRNATTVHNIDTGRKRGELR